MVSMAIKRSITDFTAHFRAGSGRGGLRCQHALDCPRAIAHPADDVVLNGATRARRAGFFLAEDRGYFREAGWKS